MGNRAVTNVLSDLAIKEPVLAGRIRQVVLAAPDIDADYFKRTVGPKLVSAGMSVTLYASSEDWALKLSKKFHGAQRAGDTRPDVVVVKGIHTIDASGVDTSLAGTNHSYYAEGKTILSDVHYLLRGDIPSKRFRLSVRDSGGGPYYVFKP
jgi:esterase/lipase superfamily enzyme